MKKLLSALFVLALCSSVAMATVPDPSNCEVTPDLNNGVLICPDNPVLLNGTTYTITVRNADNNPIPNAAARCSTNMMYSAIRMSGLSRGPRPTGVRRLSL